MGSDEFDLEKCLEAVRGNDEAMARALVEHLHPLVIRIVRSHLPRRMADEDLAQETFLKLFSKLHQYSPRAGVPFEHWVSRLTVRTCLDALRAEQRRPELRWSDLSCEQADWLEHLIQDESLSPPSNEAAARELVDILMRQLDPKDRLVIRLLDLEGKSVREIAVITGWSTTLVKVRAFRARRKLKALASELESKPNNEEL
jgi:RNA polymerase sigma factor (sigma-70 family)